MVGLLSPEKQHAIRVAVNDMIVARAHLPFISEITEATARHFQISVQKLMGQSRKREFVRPRHVAMYLSREMTSRSWPEIGRRFGGRNHSTVMHGFLQIGLLILVDEAVARAVNDIRSQALRMAASRAGAGAAETPTEGTDHE